MEAVQAAFSAETVWGYQQKTWSQEKSGLVSIFQVCVTWNFMHPHGEREAVLPAPTTIIFLPAWGG